MTFYCGACRQEVEMKEGHSHACKSAAHAEPVYLHSLVMCQHVWQPFGDGDDSFCGKACVISKNEEILSDLRWRNGGTAGNAGRDGGRGRLR